MPKCPNCQEEITQISTSRSIILVFGDGKWKEETYDKWSIYVCPECGEELTSSDLDELGVPKDSLR